MLHQLIKRTDFCRDFSAFFLNLQSLAQVSSTRDLVGFHFIYEGHKNRSGAVFGWEERSVLLDVNYSKQLAIDGRTTS